MKPVRLFKKLGAALATGLLALGIIAGTASAAAASSGDVSSATNSSGDVSMSAQSSGDVS